MTASSKRCSRRSQSMNWTGKSADGSGSSEVLDPTMSAEVPGLVLQTATQHLLVEVGGGGLVLPVDADFPCADGDQAAFVRSETPERATDPVTASRCGRDGRRGTEGDRDRRPYRAGKTVDEIDARRSPTGLDLRDHGRGGSHTLGHVLLSKPLPEPGPDQMWSYPSTRHCANVADRLCLRREWRPPRHEWEKNLRARGDEWAPAQT